MSGKDPSDRVVVVPPSFAWSGGRYDFADCLGELVWTFPKWGESTDWGDAQVRIGEALDTVEASKGGALRLSLDDWEKLREAVKAAKPTGKYAPKLRAMLQAVLKAGAAK